jgi:catechol 2,3-dioxygenase-like lactoylglutathione lyase family enzyme
VGDQARIKYAFLDLGNTRIELNQYEIPEGRHDFDLRACDSGAAHICFQVDDVAAAYAELLASGIEFFSPPIHLDDSFKELAGISYVYFRDPDGVLLQLYELPASP